MTRPSVTHVVLIDGTFASLLQGQDTNIGQIYGLVQQRRGIGLRVHYASGQQWDAWRSVVGLAMGHGMGGRIRDAYGWLASSYRPGDRIFLFGYSRGAFAVRSLAAMIGRAGLLLPEHATSRNVRSVWRNYSEGGAQVQNAVRRAFCHDVMPIRMVGVFDTVMALGIRLPVLWMLTEPRFRFHDQHLGPEVELGAQALALDETRAAFQPILWDSADHRPDGVRQMWFRGTYADIGGQLANHEPARPLANIPLVWMLDQAERSGLPLPDRWREALDRDPLAPSVGNWRGWGKAFLARSPRVAGLDLTEAIHPSVPRPYLGPALLTGHLAAELPASPPPNGRRFRLTRRKRRLRRAQDALR